MTVEEFMAFAARLLAGSATARLDALVLLEDATKKDRAWLLAHREYVLNPIKIKKLNSQLKRRAEHEPLAYIRAKTEFYGREFQVTPATLEPRAETETMIDLLKKLKPASKLIVADIGTGSGAIAITVKLERPELEVQATEINQVALKIARKNANKLGADVNFYRGSLLEPLLALKSQPAILLCNLPYVPDGHTINQAAMFEPKIAIFGGPDGLDLYRELFGQVKELAEKPAFVLTESLPFQQEALASIAQSAGYTQIQKEDFIQVFKK